MYFTDNAETGKKGEESSNRRDYSDTRKKSTQVYSGEGFEEESEVGRIKIEDVSINIRRSNIMGRVGFNLFSCRILCSDHKSS